MQSMKARDSRFYTTSFVEIGLPLPEQIVRERPFDFMGGGSGAGRFFEKKIQDRILPEKNIGLG